MVSPVPETVVVLPTYNERENIWRIVPRVLHTIDYHVADDESPNGGGVVAQIAARDPRTNVVMRRQLRTGGTLRAVRSEDFAPREDGLEHALDLVLVTSAPRDAPR